MTYGLDVEQFRNCIVVPTLQKLTLLSVESERLVLGTCLKESGLRYLEQLGNGPARGVGQMEKETYSDIWTNFLSFRPTLRASISSLAIGDPSFDQLEGNLYFAIGMVRVHYLRASGALPVTALGMTQYWKQNYNTAKGAGDIEEALPHFERACLDA